jgi:hypothetical protein
MKRGKSRGATRAVAARKAPSCSRDEMKGLGEFVGRVREDDPIIERAVEQDPEGRMDEPNAVAREAPLELLGE